MSTRAPATKLSGSGVPRTGTGFGSYFCRKSARAKPKDSVTQETLDDERRHKSHMYDLNLLIPMRIGPRSQCTRSAYTSVVRTARREKQIRTRTSTLKRTNANAHAYGFENSHSPSRVRAHSFMHAGAYMHAHISAHPACFSAEEMLAYYGRTWSKNDVWAYWSTCVVMHRCTTEPARMRACVCGDAFCRSGDARPPAPKLNQSFAKACVLPRSQCWCFSGAGQQGAHTRAYLQACSEHAVVAHPRDQRSNVTRPKLVESQGTTRAPPAVLV